MILRLLLDALENILARVSRLRSQRRLEVLRSLGMRIGTGVQLPASTWVDLAHCYLITIGEKSRFGEQCLILAHDAQMDEFLDAGRLGNVTIHPWCQIGARSTIMAGVEIGPRTIVSPGSVVLRSLPPDTICGGNPARPLGTIEDYLAERRSELERLPRFDPDTFKKMSDTAEGRAMLAAQLSLAGGYVVERGAGGTPPAASAPSR
jgi:maltose O-acetyltransferase